MPAYSFKKQFIEPILSGQKLQTIRAVGKRRHTRVGEQMQLYAGIEYFSGLQIKWEASPCS